METSLLASYKFLVSMYEKFCKGGERLDEPFGKQVFDVFDFEKTNCIDLAGRHN